MKTAIGIYLLKKPHPQPLSYREGSRNLTPNPSPTERGVETAARTYFRQRGE